MHSPFKTLDKILNVWYIIDKGNLPTSCLIFLNLFFSSYCTNSSAYFI